MIKGKRIGAVRALLVGGVLVASGIVLERTSPAQNQKPAGGEQTLEGIVTDAMCGVKHKSAITIACIKACVDKGSNYGLVVDDKVYELEAKGAAAAKLDELRNVRAKVTGKVTGMKIAVTSVVEPPFENYNAGG
jgi:hypothetical protein